MVGAIALLCAGVFFWRRRRKQTRSKERSGAPSESGASELGDGLSGKQELDGHGKRMYEMGERDTHEIDTPMEEKHEVPAFPLAYELPAEPIPQRKTEKAERREMDGNEEKKDEGREDMKESPGADAKRDTTSDLGAQR